MIVASIRRGRTCARLTPDGIRSELDEQSIKRYVSTGEPMDKAGAYAIQGIGGLLVAGIEGSPHTVVGLPIHRLDELYQGHGRSLWTEITV